jgi:hypothetical protein
VLGPAIRASFGAPLVLAPQPVGREQRWLNVDLAPVLPIYEGRVACADDKDHRTGVPSDMPEVASKAVE